jgi:hypothetical protein
VRGRIENVRRHRRLVGLRVSYGNATFTDYPKMGTWPDGYYVTFNDFNAAGTSFLGSKVCAYDRTSMLSGAAATQQCVDMGSNYGGVLPSDADGVNSPPNGAPNYLAMWDTNSLDLWKFHVDWMQHRQHLADRAGQSAGRRIQLCLRQQ